MAVKNNVVSLDRKLWLHDDQRFARVGEDVPLERRRCPSKDSCGRMVVK
jgi:hypothetical protein